AMTRALATCLMLVCAAACASRLPAPPANDTNAMEPFPTPRVAANDAPPEILALSFNSLDVRRGTTWTGKFVTTTNVASVEVRTNLFSIDVPRRGFGKFAFSVDLLDVPPIFVRAYRLRVLARNSAGVVAEEDLPFHIR
ncbi:MAG: hypothetical protein JO192_03500, partial [Candidatus Eremiobacteraeota bacterium]|nr:hypothetical protein [Candidatus Eremiobacteraeota bacterium]